MPKQIGKFLSVPMIACGLVKLLRRIDDQSKKITLRYVRNDFDAREVISLWITRKREGQMNKVRRFRAMGSLCRQQAAYNPDQSWKLLAEAAYWEHLAEVEVSSHFQECNPTESRAPELRSAA